MPTAVLINHVAAYAAAVRKHLGDLSPEQVDDLTDGLEADLAEALDDPTRPITGEIPLAPPVDERADAGSAPTEKLSTTADAGRTSVLDLTARFGSPEAYAEELRSAAGLPPALPPGSLRRRRSPFATFRASSEALVDGIVSHRRWPAVRDFLVSLRPVWWVARAWALFFVVASIAGIPFGLGPRGFLAFLLFVAVVVVSVQHGRGIWSPPERFAGAVTVLNVIAILAFPFAASAVDGRGDGSTVATYAVEAATVEDGVYLDGDRVQNLFVYGPDGLPVDGARVVDDELRPVVVADPDGFWDPEDEVTAYWLPRADIEGRDVWNAFPLATFTDSEGEWDQDAGAWVPTEGAGVAPPAPPVDRLAPLSTAAEEPAGTGSGTDGVATEERGTTTGPAADPAAPAEQPGAPAGDLEGAPVPDTTVPAVP
ncbi:hypothetical protein [Sanguibacter sp. 25GB23B1]|uniref:hypothetical protein n=1 Tax=unclassified Sanguibacter TaxID=2645534 RepID=UPI0032AEB67B